MKKYIFTPLHPENSSFMCGNKRQIKIKLPTKPHTIIKRSCSAICILRWGVTGFITLVLTLISGFICFAETIELKSGKVITGKIIERTDQYIKVDVSGTVLTYFFDEIAKIDQTPLAAPGSLQETLQKPSSENITGEKQSFTDKEWGYSFQYPPNWERIPENNLPKGITLGLKPKEKSSVRMLIQKGNLSEEAAKNVSTLRDLVKLYFPLKGFKIGTLVPMADDAGYLVRLIYEKKQAIEFKSIEGIQGHAYLPFLLLKDCYFLTPLFMSHRKDKRFIIITVDNRETFDMYSDIDTLQNKEILRKFESEVGFKEERENAERHLKEAKSIIDSLSYDFEEKSGIDEKINLPSPSGEERPFLSEKEISSGSNVSSKPIPLGKLQELQDYLHKGDKYFANKQYKEAIAEFEKALQIDPNNATTLYLSGYTYFALSQYQTAMQYYQKVLAVAPNYGPAYVDMGNINIRLNRFDEAIKYFNKALALSPDNVAVYNGLGYAYASMSKFQEAVEYFKKALAIRNDNAESYAGLGLVYFSSGQYTEAKENFLKAKEIFMKNGDEAGVKSMDEYLRAVP